MCARRSPGASAVKVRTLFELFRHAEVFLQMGKRLPRPILELGIVAGLGICLEQRDRIPVCLHLNLIVALVEVLPFFAFKSSSIF